MFYRFGVERVQRCWKTLCQHDVCVTIIVSQLHTPCWPAYSEVKMRENEEVQVEVEVEVEIKTTDKRHISSWHHKAIAMIHVDIADAAVAAAATAFAALPQKCRENQENYSLYAAFCLRIERMNFCQAKQKKSGNKKNNRKKFEKICTYITFSCLRVCVCVCECVSMLNWVLRLPRGLPLFGKRFASFLSCNIICCMLHMLYMCI